MEKVIKCSTLRFLSGSGNNGSEDEVTHLSEMYVGRCIWDKVFNNGPSEICGR